MSTDKTRMVSLQELMSDAFLSGTRPDNTKGMVELLQQEIKSGFTAEEQTTKSSTEVFHTLKQGFKNNKAFHTWIRKNLDLTIPYKHNCLEHDHCAPFQFLSDLFFERERKALVIGHRGGAKSYNAGLLQWLLANKHSKLDGKTLGGSAYQSMMSYEAMVDFWDRAGHGSRGVLQGGKTRKNRTEWMAGSVISILTASQTSVRGPHPNILVLDELDVMDWDIFTAALSQPMSKHGIMARLIMLSTYHKIDGTMAKLLGHYKVINEDGEEEDVGAKTRKSTRVYKYCIFESLEPCKDYRCSTCPVHQWCPGEHMKKAVGYYKMQDFIDKLDTIDAGTLNSEWLCKKPDRKGLILSSFTDDNIINLDTNYLPGYPVYLGIDFGFTPGHQYAIEVFQEVDRLELPDGRIISGSILIDEIYTLPFNNGEMIKEAKKRPWGRVPSLVKGVADSAQVSMIREWKKAGFKIKGVKKGAGSIIDGLNQLISKIRPVKGEPTFYVNSKCRGFLNEKDNYKYLPSGKPKDESNDAIDASRYYVMSRKKSAILRGVTSA